MNFIELPILLFDKNIEKLEIDAEDIPGTMFIIPESVIAIRGAMDEDGEMNYSCIYLTSGESFIVTLTQKEIIKKLTK